MPDLSAAEVLEAVAEALGLVDYEEHGGRKVHGSPSEVLQQVKAVMAEREDLIQRACQLPGLLMTNDMLRGDVELLSRWIADHAKYVTGARDHACARCTPNGPLVSKTFVCARHRSEDIRAADRVSDGDQRT